MLLSQCQCSVLKYIKKRTSVSSKSAFTKPAPYLARFMRTLFHRLDIVQSQGSRPNAVGALRFSILSHIETLSSKLRRANFEPLSGLFSVLFKQCYLIYESFVPTGKCSVACSALCVWRVYVFSSVCIRFLSSEAPVPCRKARRGRPGALGTHEFGGEHKIWF